ncbi:MAG: malto-oligosyltrehalose synthase, partial [Enterobacter kobei]|nr:malto-oligosyltrehalose synthase [Enterobacter kobei]
LPQASQQLLQKVVARVKNSDYAPDTEALDFVAAILASDEPAAATFRTRFQQLTGPLMAKSVEDTLFFRQHMDLALNEVGAEPLPRVFSLDRFHAEMKTRLERQPDALSGTSTHDTKRGEDARARLYSLTEAPDDWAAHVVRWHQMNDSKVTVLFDGPTPKPELAWMLYQALAGVWPVTLTPQDTAGLQALEERFIPFVEKALREAKLRTDWADSNDVYETVVLDYARHLLSPDNQAFLEDFYQTLQPFVRAGLVNSLTQTVIKLTAPGVPDIYQGSETLNFSLVDPDNRREPDFAALEQHLFSDDEPVPTSEADWMSGALKQQVITHVLHYRQRKPDLFRRGDYVPLAATGDNADHLIAFARQQGNDALIVIAPRLVLPMQQASDALTTPQRWPQTAVTLPAALANRRYRDLLTGEEVVLTDQIHLENVDCCSSVIYVSQ